MSLTRTWFEHATFWSGVRRATVAPPGLLATGWSERRSSLTSDLLNRQARCQYLIDSLGQMTWCGSLMWSHGVMVSTLDFESSDPSSNLGGTSYLLHATQAYQKSHDGDTDKRQQREHGNMQSILLCGSENFIRFQLQLTQSIAFDSQVNVET